MQVLGVSSRFFHFLMLRIFQRNGLKLDKALIFSGLVQIVYVYRMAKPKKIWPVGFYAIKVVSWEKNAWALMAAPKNGAKTVELWLIASDWD